MKEHFLIEDEKSVTSLLGVVNELAREGFTPLIDTLTKDYHDHIFSVIVERDIDYCPTDKHADFWWNLIQTTLNAENQVDHAKKALQDKKDSLLLYTDWAGVSEKLGTKISNQAQRDAYIRTCISEEREAVQEAQAHLAELRRLEQFAREHGVDAVPPEPKEEEVPETPDGVDVEELKVEEVVE